MRRARAVIDGFIAAAVLVVVGAALPNGGQDSWSGLDIVVSRPADAQCGAMRRKTEEAKPKVDSASKRKAEDSARARPDSTKSGGAAPASGTVTGAQAPASPVPERFTLEIDAIGPPGGVYDKVGGRRCGDGS